MRGAAKTCKGLKIVRTNIEAVLNLAKVILSFVLAIKDIKVSAGNAKFAPAILQVVLAILNLPLAMLRFVFGGLALKARVQLQSFYLVLSIKSFSGLADPLRSQNKSRIHS